MNDSILGIMGIIGTLTGTLIGIGLGAYLKRKHELSKLLVDSYGNYFSEIQAAFYSWRDREKHDKGSEEWIEYDKIHGQHYKNFNKYGAMLSAMGSTKLKKHLGTISEKWDEISNPNDSKAEREFRDLLDKLIVLIKAEL